MKGTDIMTAKILCPTDGTDHAMIGVILAAEVAKATGGHLTICAVNIAHGGVRGPTISHWKPEEVQKLLTDSEAMAKTDGAADIGTVEIVAREAAPAETDRRRAAYRRPWFLVVRRASPGFCGSGRTRRARSSNSKRRAA